MSSFNQVPQRTPGSLFSQNARANPIAAPTGIPNASKVPGAPGTGMMSKVKGMMSGKTPIILLIVGVLLIFIIVILYILFMMKSGKLAGKQLTKKPVKLDDLTTILEISSTEIPKTVVGREYSYSFWLYIENYDQTIVTPATPSISTAVTQNIRNATNQQVTPADKLIFYRGTAGDISNANPIVTMDGLSNKMFIAIKCQDTTLTPTPGIIDYNANLYNIRYMNYFINSDLKLRDTAKPESSSINKYLILNVDYVPLQRWVNVTFIVDNKIITVYLDGEIYSVKNTEEFKTHRQPELDIRGRPIDVNIIVDKTDNNIYVGKNKSVGSGNTVNGYLGKLQFFNYALAMNDVKLIYAQGPIGAPSWFGGKVSYGVRNPVYKLDEAE